jgi:hypothetical protein
MLICTLAGVALCTSGNAVTSDAPGNPYQGIVDRNVFGLKSPPPPPDPEANKPPPPKIFLTGITTILGNKRALLKTTPPPKPGEPAKEQSFTLGEGQREGEIEVLEINEKAGTVKVNDYGTITTLDFDKDGVKVAGGIPPAPGGAAARPGGFVPGPAANPFTPAGGANALPRPMRLPTPTGAAASPALGGATPAYAGGVPAYGGSTPGLTVGGTTVPLSGSTAVQAQPQAQAGSQLTAEQQFLMVEAERARLQQQGLSSKFPPIPPTPLTSELNPGTTGTPTTGATTPTAPAWPPRAPSLPPLLPNQKSF